MFSMGNCGYSLSDIAAVSGSGNNNSNCDGWGGGGAWWIIILFLFVFCGWGDNGWGNNRGGNGSGSGSTTREEISYGFDMNGLESGVRGIQQGLCDGFYAMNTGMLNGFSNIQQSICNEFRSTDNAICNLGYEMQSSFNASNVANMQNTNALTMQLNNMAAQNAACCCETQRQIEKGFSDTNYNLATQSCDTRRAICDSTRDIIDNQNANTRSILDFLTNDKINTLQAENQTLKFAASQQAQNNYLVSELKPCPIPAYIMPNPYCNCGNGYNNNCGNFNNCGCGGCGC